MAEILDFSTALLERRKRDDEVFYERFEEIISAAAPSMSAAERADFVARDHAALAKQRKQEERRTV